MKGQFFVLGAVLLCIAFYMGMQTPSPDTVRTGYLSYIRENLDSEFPRSLNFGLENGSGTSGLENFTRFADASLKARGVGFSCLWVAYFPSDLSAPGSAINVTVGNWLGSSATVNVTLSGSGWSSTSILSPADSGVASALFSGAPESFTVSVSFNSRQAEISTATGRAGLYSYFILGSGDDRVVREVVA